MATRATALKALPQPAATAIAPVRVVIAASIKALHAGTASPHQQQLALRWLIEEAGGKSHFPYHQSDRDTAFALGRLFVADQIVGLINADLSSLRRQNHVETPPSTSEAR